MDQVRHESIVICNCDCGTVGFVAKGYNVRKGFTKSCGCARAIFVSRNRAVHGDSRRSGKAPEFDAWARMLYRCFNPNSKNYKDYGGRGITVCAEWTDSYEAFLAHIGRRPSAAHQLDRIQNSGNYEPGNIRWATRKEQCRNRRSSRMITAFGATRTMAEWVERTGIDQPTLWQRLKRGWTVERSLSTPVRSH